MQRFLAFLIVLLPGLLAGYGIKLMRDVFFGILNIPFYTLWLQFFSGLIAFLIGLSFVGGFIYYRDQKQKKVQKRFTK